MVPKIDDGAVAAARRIVEAMILLVFVGLFWIAPIFVAANATKEKRGSTGLGVLLGVVLGWIGAIIALCLSPTVIREDAGAKRRCPYCAELIRWEAVACKHCGRDVPELDGFPEGHCQGCGAVAAMPPTPRCLACGRPHATANTGAVCANGHDNVLGARRCSTCGTKALAPF